jgi:ABC-type nitrate/sulfonate/bicarbonate transport system substrate-binding protein
MDLHKLRWNPGRFAVVAASALALTVTAACGSSGSKTDTASTPTAPAPAATTANSSPTSSGSAAPATVDNAKTVFVFNSTPQEQDLPELMAIDAMKTQGYDISTKQLDGSVLPFQALASNQGQLTGASLPEGALAVQAGSDVKIVVARNQNQVVWVADNKYKDCSKLNGQKVGIYSETGGYTILMKLYFAKACPDVKPTYVTIPDSPVRAQAVATGKIAGTALGLPDAIALQQANPDGSFFVLPLSTEIPGVGDEYVYANGATLKDHPGIVQAFVTEQLKAIRQLYGDDDAALSDLVKKYLPDTKNTDVLKSMVTSKLWYANGGLEGPGLDATLKGFDLTQTPDQLQDKTAVEAALKDIGKSDLTQF